MELHLERKGTLLQFFVCFLFNVYSHKILLTIYNSNLFTTIPQRLYS